MEVQIFGVRKSADTRAALRFFADRRIKTHFVELSVGPAEETWRAWVAAGKQSA